jgi:transcriptional regulator with XRE-family HTH domain
MQEPIGKRIARLRQECGLTQQALAARLAISRVAVSQIEMNLIVPSERTVTLLAGVFKLSPQALVDSTTYPLAKAERLPQVACCYTALEHDLALLENDLTWLKRLSEDCSGANDIRSLALEVAQEWLTRLRAWREQAIDEADRAKVQKALEKVQLTTKDPK